ncbi:phenylacetate--CoA ligase family protein [Nocardia huaxiensis]|uniref:Phenylacetate--CoA ligase family protein n=1 Tax=Nocardia huaxiensis TaxID=2755382 RepID=A0A7D6YYV3_9NOCA|nr:AMP-binding protein [Nocardia huaxiensis]QLY27726.1 phenylacetate--CoA ligase family protein [Nocardia huaxiensis]UFS98885.1 AMP-binding protein [Nocardia huaxiensis]
MTYQDSSLSFKHRLRRVHPRRGALRRTLATLDRADAATIRAFQEQRLRKLVGIAAARSPFYREWFRDHGIDPSSIRTLADLPRLPLISRADLVGRADRFRTRPRRLMWPAMSSGSSGRPVQVYRTMTSSVLELTALERQWSWFGVPADSRRVVLRGNGFASGGADRPTLLLPGAGQLLVSSFYLTPERIDAIIEDIQRFDPHAIEGWPSSIALLAALLRDRGVKIPVRAIITSSEMMTPGQQALMREVYTAPIVDHYGQTERVALAGTCEEGGYHAFPDYGIVELVPLEGCEDRWEIVGTPLHNTGFPLFRYRTGDEVRPPEPGRNCPCGRAFPLLGTVDGRVDDIFTSADGRPLPLGSTVLDDLTGLREAQIAQRAPGVFEVRFVPGDGFSEHECAAEVRAAVTRLFGPGQRVDIRVVDSLPRSPSGKLKSAVVESGDVITLE